MTRRTRFFLYGSAGVLAAGLCTGLVAYYGGFPTGAFSRAVGPNELRYVPEDASVVAYANVRDVMTSQFRERLRGVLPEEGRGREEFRDKTGIDIENDLDYVLACMVGKPADAEHPGGLVLARGRFDAARLEALAVAHNAVVVEYRGRRLVKLPDDDDAHMVMAFVEAGLVALGDENTVHRAIDTADGGQNITANAEMMGLLDEAAGDGNAWAVGRFDAIAEQAKLPAELTGRMPPIHAFSAAGRINGGVSTTVRARTPDPESAENLRQVVQGFVALAKMQAGSRPELQTLIQSVDLAVSGNTVALSVSVPAEVIDVFLPRARQGVEPR